LSLPVGRCLPISQAVISPYTTPDLVPTQSVDVTIPDPGPTQPVNHPRSSCLFSRRPMRRPNAWRLNRGWAKTLPEISQINWSTYNYFLIFGQHTVTIQNGQKILFNRSRYWIIWWRY
jgi:hypothetical protein